MLKSVLKCIESIRINKWVKKFKIPSANLVGRGGLGQVGQKPYRLVYLNFQFYTHISLREIDTDQIEYCTI